MRRSLIILLAVLSLAAYGQNTGETYLRNLTDATLYVLTQGSDGGIGPTADYRQVPPRGLLPVDPSKAVEGFAYERGNYALETFAFAAERLSELTRSRASRTYVPVADRHLTVDGTLQASSFSELIALPRIDNQYLDWVGRDARIARGRDRQPVASFVDLGEGREPLALTESLVWKKGGTDVEWIKAFSNRQELFFAAAAHSAFNSGTSIFLYLYPPASDQPVATIEIPAGEETGFVFLWVPQSATPLVVGNVVSSEFFLEAQLWSDAVGEVVGDDFMSLTVNVTTGNASAGVWEEFVLARTSFQTLFGE